MILGKVEGVGHEWHGHVTAITVAPEYRRLHLGKNMMDLLERISDQVYHGFFVDLYVRLSNDKAIGMYERLGYSIYRRVRKYYGSAGPGNIEDEDAYDMRKALPRDVDRRSVRLNGKNIFVNANEVS
ncbi:N(alpha)-acetyltransferase 20, NatB catalyticsubunit [Clathrus columnatus]|uniref:N(Alpha)-acetyltransferase 20, NatB catalyticsubunit n=1 Tax=Clathrus columnatus TaxID=1419009 RepID=A0AAV5AIU1_9AGAM|nr:N(alpha)-acetyltransferase 20, NatB catalyticsubunit [Clathrus columnatus]